MARIIEPTKEMQDEWNDWVQSRPEPVMSIAKRLEPWSLYFLKPTGQRVVVTSYFEDGTVTVLVSGKFNALLHECEVFGIDPNDLVPCELPAPDDPTGCMMSADDVADNIDALRVMARPDLFFMGSDGIAKRKS